MLVIRLTRVGKRNSPAYRVVVADKKKAVKRKFIEIIGNYNPTLNPKQLVIAKERALFWIGNGAQPSTTVNNLMCDLEILPKKNKIKKVYGKKQSKKSLKEGGAETRAPEAKKEEENEAPAEEVKSEATEEQITENKNEQTVGAEEEQNTNEEEGENKK